MGDTPGDNHINYTQLDRARLDQIYNPRRPSKLFSSLSVVALLVVSLFGTMFYSFQVSQNDMSRIKADASNRVTPKQLPHITTLTIGTDATFPPMEYTDAQKNLIGYDIDLGNKLGQVMGTTVVFKNITWDNLFPALEANQIDAIMSAVTITDERSQKYLFSDPYLNAGQVIMTSKEVTTINDVADLKGKKIGVQKGTTNETEALKYTDPTMVISYADFEEAVTALINKTVDAVILDLPGAKGIIDKHPNVRITSDPFTSEFYGITFNKNNPTLQKEVNAALSTLQQQGILTDLKHKWFE